MKLKEFDVEDNGAEATFELPAVKATLKLTYTLTAEGEVIIRQQLDADDEAKVAPMFRYGMQLQMPQGYNSVKYYGRGPVENYCDRHDSEFLGVYEAKVADEYFPYVRPQESGNHTDVRWFRVLDAEGKGLEFYAGAPIEVSALNYLTEDLDDGPVKDKVSVCSRRCISSSARWDSAASTPGGLGRARSICCLIVTMTLHMS